MRKKSPPPPPTPAPIPLSPLSERLIRNLQRALEYDPFAERAAAKAQGELEFQQLAAELAAAKAERQKLWGSKFPLVVGQRPGDRVVVNGRGVRIIRAGRKYRKPTSKPAAKSAPKSAPKSTRKPTPKPRKV